MPHKIMLRWTYALYVFLEGPAPVSAISYLIPVTVFVAAAEKHDVL